MSPSLKNIEKLLQRTSYQSTGQPTQVRLLGQDGDKPIKPMIFESVSGAYHSTVEIKKKLPNGEEKTFHWTKLILKTEPAAGFLFPGKFKHFQDNKTKHLSVYLKKRLLFYYLIAFALEVGQVWYLVFGRFDEGVGLHFWNDPWLRPAFAFAAPWIYILWSWDHEDSDLAVIYLQLVRDLQDEAGHMFYVCTRSMNIFTVLKDLMVDFVDDTVKDIKEQIGSIALKKDPSDVVTLKNTVAHLQTRLNLSGGSGGGSTDKYEHEEKMRKAGTIRAAVVLSVIFGSLFGFLAFLAWLWWG